MHVNMILIDVYNNNYVRMYIQLNCNFWIRHWITKYEMHVRRREKKYFLNNLFFIHTRWLRNYVIQIAIKTLMLQICIEIFFNLVRRFVLISEFCNNWVWKLCLFYKLHEHWNECLGNIWRSVYICNILEN